MSDPPDNVEASKNGEGQKRCRDYTAHHSEHHKEGQGPHFCLRCSRLSPVSARQATRLC